MASTDSPVISAANDGSGALRRTDDATQVTAISIPTQDDAAYFVEVRITAVETDFSAGATFWRQATFVNDGGTLAIVGSVRTIGTDNNTIGGTSSVTLDASGENIRVRVTGVAATNIQWLISPYVLKLDAADIGIGWLNASA